MSKHTPGLWVSSVFCAVNGDDCVGVKSLATFGAVAWVGGLNDDETNANARLIASAPDLLYIASWIEKEYEEGDGTIPDGLYNAARAAIKKATKGKA